jgi:putative ABC transport system substrate-binding protein
MRRREFITVLGGATVAWPIAARAQQAGNLRTVGVLGAEANVWSGWTAIFAKRLRELGWVEGNTLTIQYRWSEGRSDRAAEIAAEFVRLKVDVIVAPGSAIAILKRAAPTIPLVFPMAVDPVGSGLVAGLARPGGNVTGLSIQQTDLAGKRLELLRQVVPQLRRLGIIADAGYADSMREMDEVQAIARKVGVEVAPLKIQRAEDIAPAIAALTTHADALYVVSDAFIGANRTRIITLALEARLPTILSFRDYVQAGGLMSYGPNFADHFQRTAELVDKILRGTKPADIPVEQPTKFEFVVNLSTAKALGLTIPESILSLANEVIE